MTTLELYAVFGVPALLMLVGAIGYFIVRHSDHDHRKAH